jgi:hypothetical protein
VNGAAASCYASTVRPLIEKLQGQSLSLREIAVELNQRNVQTPRGGKWHAQQVANILHRVV